MHSQVDIPLAMLSETVSHFPQDVTRNLGYKLQADRVLTPSERRQLDAAIQVFEEQDIFARFELLRRVFKDDPVDPSMQPDPTDDFHWGFDLAILSMKMLGHADAIPTLERIVRDSSQDESLRGKAVRRWATSPTDASFRS